MRTVILKMTGTDIVVHFMADRILVRVRSYPGMTVAFKFDVCAWIEMEAEEIH